MQPSVETAKPASPLRARRPRSLGETYREVGGPPTTIGAGRESSGRRSAEEKVVRPPGDESPALT